MFGLGKKNDDEYELTEEEQEEASLKFITFSSRLGPVGKRDETWKTSDE